jgi:AcrR family transcriptional regulator
MPTTKKEHRTRNAPSRFHQKTERRQAIVEAAARLFADVGYGDCEIERVAAELKIAKGTLYLYFSSKEALFYACVDAGMSALQQAINAAIEPAADPFQRIAAAVSAYLRFFEEHPQHAELLIQERASFKHRKRPTYFEYRDASRDRWRKLYNDLQESGRIRSDIEVERLLDTIGNLLYGTMFTNHFIGRSVGREEQEHATLEIIFRGIWSDAERQQRTKPGRGL